MTVHRIGVRARLAAAVAVAVGLGGAGALVRPAAAVSPGPVGRIAFQSNRSGNYEIYKMNPDGTHPANLTNNPAYDEFASWSPDSARILFSSNRDGDFDIYVMNADGSGVMQLTNSPGADRAPTFTGDGQKIAFVSQRLSESRFDIFFMDADGSDQTLLWSEGAAPHVCGDSATGVMVFSSTADPLGSNPSRDGEVFSMTVTGTDLTQLTFNSVTDSGPKWSPDCSAISFNQETDGAQDVFRAAADGTGAVNLTNNSAVDSFPAWSPDGASIAFVSNRDEGGLELYRMSSTDGSEVTRLTAIPGADSNFLPDWGSEPLPTISLQSSVFPASRPAPGGSFAYTLILTNTSGYPVTIRGLTDTVYGDLTTAQSSTCRGLIGTVLAPAAGSSCTFTGTVTGPAGSVQSNTTTATATDMTATAASDTSVTSVALTAEPAPATTSAAATAAPSPAPSSTRAPSATPSASRSATPVTSGSGSPVTTTGPCAAVATTVLRASHTQITAGNAPTLVGIARDADGTPCAGVLLRVLHKPYPASGYSVIATVTTDRSGRFALVVRPLTRTAYGVNTPDQSVRSNVVVIRVNTRVTLVGPHPPRAPARTTGTTNPVLFIGHLTPGHAFVPVGLGTFRDGRFVVLQQTWTDQSGRFALARTLPAGVSTTVVFTSAHAGNQSGATSISIAVT